VSEREIEREEREREKERTAGIEVKFYTFLVVERERE
jgi:hypothetical protein